LLAEAKAHCRIEVTDDDALVTALIVAARVTAEQYCNRAFINQSWKQVFDSYDLSQLRSQIQLRKNPVVSITSVTGYASDGTPTVAAAPDYFISGDRVILTMGSSWPAFGREFDALEIVFVAGYGAGGGNVPGPITQAIKMLVAHLYENREAGGDPIVSERYEHEIPFGVRAILQPFRVYAIL